MQWTKRFISFCHIAIRTTQVVLKSSNLFRLILAFVTLISHNNISLVSLLKAGNVNLVKTHTKESIRMFTFLAFLSFHFMSKSLKEISTPRRVVGSNKAFILSLRWFL